jgi:hypothetical protein
MGHDYWIVLKLSGNERSGNETNIAEKIVFEYATFGTLYLHSCRKTRRVFCT